ncbi:MAG: desulfoferrodoxin [Oscillospiraceae bacterium]|nr:desulfoferrodoxin [Oscillospiraceae bacterium]
MKSRQKFVFCKYCGNMAGVIKDKAVPMVCCGEEMAVLTPNTVEASTEKHLPDVSVSGGSVSVRVGSVPHPMEEAHHITFVYVETERGGQRKQLKVGEEPALEFSLANDTPVAVYAYCNLHGLWAVDL